MKDLNLKYLIFIIILLSIFNRSYAGSEGIPDLEIESGYGSERIPVIELESKYRGQTIYIIKIYKYGKIHFHANEILVNGRLTQTVATLGDSFNKISREQLNELFRTFLSSPFTQLEKYVKAGAENSPARIIRYRSDIAFIEINSNIFFLIMTKKLKEISDIEKWICFPKDHPAYYDNCLQDLPDNFQY